MTRRRKTGLSKITAAGTFLRERCEHAKISSNFLKFPQISSNFLKIRARALRLGLASAAVTATMAALASGCVAGRVMVTDGTTSWPAANTEVRIYQCPACTPRVVSTDSEGKYVYNAYDANGNLVDPMWPQQGEEALLIDIPAYGVHAYHRPDWELYEQDGLTGGVTYVPDIMVPAEDANPWNPVYRKDQDGDGFVAALEQYYGTSDTDWDTDDDSLSDGQEVVGYNWVDYSAYGASPLRLDVLVEADYFDYNTPEGNVSVYPTLPIRDALAQFFQDQFAGVDNPDGSHGIHFVLAPDTKLAESAPCNVAYGMYPERNPRKQSGFRYARYCKDGPGTGAAYGEWVNGHNTLFDLTRPVNRAPDILYHAGAWLDDDVSNDTTTARPFFMYSVTLHEIGHTMQLHHGGVDDWNYKPNYPSLMNYELGDSFDGSPATIAETKIQYSRGLLTDLDESNLSETNPFPGLPFSEVSYLRFWYTSTFIGTETSVIVNEQQQVMVDWNNQNGFEPSIAYHLLPYPPPEFLVLRDNDDIARARLFGLAQALPKRVISEDPGVDVVVALQSEDRPLPNASFSLPDGDPAAACDLHLDDGFPSVVPVRRSSGMSLRDEEVLSRLSGLNGRALRLWAHDAGLDLQSSGDEALLRAAEGTIMRGREAPLDRFHDDRPERQRAAEALDVMVHSEPCRFDAANAARVIAAARSAAQRDEGGGSAPVGPRATDWSKLVKPGTVVTACQL